VSIVCAEATTGIATALMVTARAYRTRIKDLTQFGFTVTTD
jgi:hypothetical protein